MHFFTFILKNLLRRKVRSALTCSGIAIAVGTMVALLGVTNGFERSTLDAFEQRGVDLVLVQEGVPDQLNSDLDQAIGDRIRRLPGVKAVAAGLVEVIGVPRGKTILNVIVQGWEPDSFNFDALEIRSGRRLRPDDRRGALLGATLAENLKKHVGDSIDIQGEAFQVIGIYQSFNVFDNGAVTVLLSALQAVSARPGRVTGFSVVVDGTGGAGGAAECVRQEIEGLHERLAALPTREYVSTSMHIRLAHAMAWLTSVIAVLIGLVGMLNTMVMSVFERTHEIGILRAIGWRPGRVVRMVLGEALLLCLAGAVLGTLAAVALTRFLTSLPEASGFVAGEVPPAVMARGFLMALLVGLLGGLYPAYRAARLLPTEALRHE